MNPNILCRFLYVAISICGIETLCAQGTAFTYQGQINSGGNPANGSYDLAFSLYNSATLASPVVAGPVTNSAVAVTNGLFTVQLNFGPGIFSGTNYWLQLAVRTNGTAGFTTLSPRQPLLPAPYAIFANAASNLIGTLPTTQLSGSLLANQLSGRLALAQLPGAVVTNNATGLNLSGSFSGSFSGSGLTNLGGTFVWQTVSGTTQQARPNIGYIVTNNNSLVTVTLPTNANIGDVVRVSGNGAGGWEIAQNAGQFVYSGNLGGIGIVWTAHDPSTNWQSVASSADGTKLVAVVFRGQIYTSTDSGANWTARGISTNWQSVASSSDGTKLVAVADPGQIYTSTDSGANWTARTIRTNWSCVASSADGTKLVAGISPENVNIDYTSTDSGVTWTAQSGPPALQSVASSADGTKLVAGPTAFGPMFTSTNSGVTWSPHDIGGNWGCFASSADGTKLVAGVLGSPIYTSTNSGVTWSIMSAISAGIWKGVASSADGTKLVAVDHGISGGYIYTSTDSGMSWTARDSVRYWNSVASSSDGSKLVAVVSNNSGSGQIYTSNANTTSGTAGYLLGVQDTAIELQYLGNGQFIPISHEGIIQAF